MTQLSESTVLIRDEDSLRLILTHYIVLVEGVKVLLPSLNGHVGVWFDLLLKLATVVLCG